MGCACCVAIGGDLVVTVFTINGDLGANIGGLKAKDAISGSGLLQIGFGIESDLLASCYILSGRGSESYIASACIVG